MKKIPKPELKSATVMGPFDMNKVPFSKTRTVLTPEQLDKIANGKSTSTAVAGNPGMSDPIPKKGASDPIPGKGGSSSSTTLGGSDSVSHLGDREDGKAAEIKQQ